MRECKQVFVLRQVTPGWVSQYDKECGISHTESEMVSLILPL